MIRLRNALPILAALAIAPLVVTPPAAAQGAGTPTPGTPIPGTPAPATPAPGAKAINTGGPQGAYHSLFCPPIPVALAGAYFQGYACTPSRGTVENIERVLATPSQLGFAQLDVFAGMAAARPEEFRRLALIRQDLACEGLWMVTRNEQLAGYGDVLGLARRIPFITLPEGSGSAASFAFLQQNDPEGLGRVQPRNIRRAADATAVINAVAEATDGAVGFFVQFADPQNVNIRLIAEKNLRIIPVVSREVLRARVADQAVYEVQTFSMTGGGVFTRARELTTACTPVAIFTGSPEALGTAKGVTQDDQRELIAKVRAIPVVRLLPQEGRVAQLISGAKRVTASATEEMTRAADATKRAVERQFQN